jgi:hypothetical protein
MRRILWALGVMGAGISAGGLIAVGCIDPAADCAQIGTCCPDGTLTCFRDAGHDAGPTECSGLPSAANISETCGVFVRADATSSHEDGTRANPYRSLQKAIDHAAGKRVYACASAPLAEAITIASGVEVYGGFDCASGWTWSGEKRTALDGAPDQIVLTIAKGAEGTKIEGLTITAASPADMTGGGSSIAVVVDDIAVTLDRCDVRAGDAADGPDGVTVTTTATKGGDAPPVDSMTSNACVLPAAVAGGAPGATTCDDGSTNSGGVGGKGGITGTDSGNGQKGGDGQPPDGANGLGGAGEAGAKCGAGASGHDGDPGAPGPGGSPAGDTLSVDGISSADKTDGKAGTPGQGGGGGGAAKAGIFCGSASSPVDGPGASGGGGGGGGCAGKGGGGGKAGGSSIAIVSLGAKLTLANVSLAVGKGGKGGKGALGQGGGLAGTGAGGGGPSGIGTSKPGCRGGDGGLGGAGGPGGGGRGGHAIGIAYAKAPSKGPALKGFTPGAAGDGGHGGTGAPASSDGATGSAGACWDFAAHAGCAP